MRLPGVKIFTYEDIPIVHPPVEKPHFEIGDTVYVNSLYGCPIRMTGIIIKDNQAIETLPNIQYLVEFPNEARWWFWPATMEKV